MERQLHTAASEKRLVRILQRGIQLQQPHDLQGPQRGSDGVGIQTFFIKAVTENIAANTYRAFTEFSALGLYYLILSTPEG